MVVHFRWPRRCCRLFLRSVLRAYKFSIGSAFVALQLGNQPLQGAASLREQSFSCFPQLIKNWVLCHRTAPQETRQACK